MTRVAEARGWRELHLGDVAKIERENVPPEKIVPGTNYVGLNAIDPSGVVEHPVQVKSGYIASNKFAFRDNHILYGKLRPYLKKIAIPGFSGICSTDILPISVDSKVIDNRYLFHYLRQPALIDFVTTRSSGVNLPRISPSILSELPVRFPRELAEQRRIAAILDKADAVRRKRRHALDLADNLLHSSFIDMFGDPASLEPRFPRAPLREFGRILTGNTPPRSDTENYGIDIEWIKSDNIAGSEIIVTKAKESLSLHGRTRARIAPAGSTLVTCIAGSPSSIGNSALTDREVAFNQQINALIPGAGTDPYFIYAQTVVGKRLIQRASTNSMKGMVSKSQFEAVEFLMPAKKLQSEFGERFEVWLRTRKRLSRQIENASCLFGSLSQRAFRGNL